MIRYRHTNLIARNWRSLSAFYQRALELTPVPPERDLSGGWVDRLTRMPGAHITGEHLKLPGSDATLEIFSYEAMERGKKALNREGFAHIAFEVDDVPGALARIISEGGGQAGELVSAEYPGGVTATFVYAADPEGNLIELQSWKRP